MNSFSQVLLSAATFNLFIDETHQTELQPWETKKKFQKLREHPRLKKNTATCETKRLQPAHSMSSYIDLLVFSDHDDAVAPYKQLSDVPMIELGSAAMKYLIFE